MRSNKILKLKFRTLSMNYKHRERFWQELGTVIVWLQQA
jgi:hypothetical protein